MRRLAVFALLAAAASGGMPPASAGDICAQVDVVVPGPVIKVGPVCVPYGDVVDCAVVSAGTASVEVIVTVCVPAP